MNLQSASLSHLQFIPYLNADGTIAPEFEGKVGVYAIFDADKVLQYIGYSRDVALSLKQHVVRQPQKCYWLKVQTIDRPSRTVLEEIRAAWIAEHGAMPPGNSTDEAQWNQPIDAKNSMTDEERSLYEKSDEISRVKLLKHVSRRVEAEVLASLQARSAAFPIRFDPKLKEEGLLNLK